MLIHLASLRKDYNFANNMDLQTQYLQHIDRYAVEITSLKQRTAAYVCGEIASFGAGVVFVICQFALPTFSYWWMLAVMSLILYFVIRHFDDKNGECIRQLSALQQVYEDEMRTLKNDFSNFDQGERYLNPQHPYAFDMDVFGKNSLYNRMCKTITTGGSDALASHLAPTEFPMLEQIREDGELQRCLAENHSWCIRFLALGKLSLRKEYGAQINTNAVMDAVGKVQAMQIPGWFGRKISKLIALLFCAGVVVSVILAACGILSATIPLWWVMVQYIFVFGVCKRTLDHISRFGEHLRCQLLAYTSILHLISEHQFASTKGKRLQASLQEALPSFTRLEKILRSYDRRGNFLCLFFTDAFLFSDFFLVRSFLAWKQTYLGRMEEWMQIVSDMDAHVSMADFRYNHSEAVDAELIESDKVVYEAENLYHPFLGSEAVKNDFVIQNNNYYIVTGANMAGKSTFLRSLGINYLLAMAGMPIFADKFKVSRFSLFSSMRTTDDLIRGISYFNAELLRLQQLLAHCRQSSRTLIILDEILKGTNSLDKLNGSRLFLETISQLPVSGVIATHDLELSKMEDEHPNRFHNYCFEIDLGTDVTYTYKIKEGVARNQNATFLLHKLLENGMKTIK